MANVVKKQLIREFPSLPQTQQTELEEWLQKLLSALKLEAKWVEALEFSRVARTVTLYTTRESIEIGLDATFGPPRRRRREFVSEAYSRRPFDESGIDALLGEHPEVLAGLFREVSPAIAAHITKL